MRLGTRGRGGHTPGELSVLARTSFRLDVCLFFVINSFAPTSPERTDSKNERVRCFQCLLIGNVKCPLCLKAILLVSVSRRGKEITLILKCSGLNLQINSELRSTKVKHKIYFQQHGNNLRSNMCAHGCRGARGGRRRLGACRWQNGRLLQQDGRKIDERHQRRNNMDKHKYGNSDSCADSDRVVLHSEGEVH